MPIICRLIALEPATADQVKARPTGLEAAVKAAKSYADVYRYWDGIGWLLGEHRPRSAAAGWLTLGAQVSEAEDRIPGARLIAAPELKRLSAELDAIEPDDLAPAYDAVSLDEAKIYPVTWVEWEETFDPLGQMLEHYSFLQHFARRTAAAGQAMVLYFEDDGDDF